MLGASQSQMIAILGMDLTNSRISEYETGLRIPSLLTLLAYARVGGVTVEQLIDDRVNLP
jgi:transcriptional regulator with XRE-family HTH domain